MQAAQLSSRSVFVYILLFEVKISVTGQNCSKPGRPASLFKSLYLSQSDYLTGLLPLCSALDLAVRWLTSQSVFGLVAQLWLS